jgi:hypothetical protein
MNIGEILVWESSNLLLLVPVVIWLVMLVRWLQGRPVFTERDWLLLFGHPREKAFTQRLWFRFAALLLVVVAIDFVLGLYVLPYGLGCFVGALILPAIEAAQSQQFGELFIT